MERTNFIFHKYWACSSSRSEITVPRVSLRPWFSKTWDPHSHAFSTEHSSTTGVTDVLPQHWTWHTPFILSRTRAFSVLCWPRSCADLDLESTRAMIVKSHQSNLLLTLSLSPEALPAPCASDAPDVTNSSYGLKSLTPFRLTYIPPVSPTWHPIIWLVRLPRPLSQISILPSSFFHPARLCGTPQVLILYPKYGHFKSIKSTLPLLAPCSSTMCHPAFQTCQSVKSLPLLDASPCQS